MHYLVTLSDGIGFGDDYPLKETQFSELVCGRSCASILVRTEAGAEIKSWPHRAGKAAYNDHGQILGDDKDTYAGRMRWYVEGDDGIPWSIVSWGEFPAPSSDQLGHPCSVCGEVVD